MNRGTKRTLLSGLGGIAVGVLLLVLTAASCGGGTSASDASQKASDKLQGQVYQSKHNVEFRNYNLRQKMADDPSTILWCTFAWPGQIGQQLVTVPIAGKLTSSNKRPYPGTTTADNNGPGIEVPGPDHMYGSSAEYRYGFDPTLTQYSDFTDLPSYCTNVPTVWQQNQTTIISQTSTTLDSISKAAQAAIKSGDPSKAAAILKTAETAQAKVKTK